MQPPTFERLVINWLRWPAKPGNTLLPWYRVLWRGLWLCLLVYPGLVLAGLGILLADGYAAAMLFWYSVR